MSGKHILIIVGIIVVAGGIYLMTKESSAPTQNDANQNTQEQTNNSNNQGKDTGTAMEQATELKKETLKEGTGEGAKTGDTVTVQYVGTFLDGTKFDSSRDPGRTPFSFQLGTNQVIQGWEQGILGMKIGELRKLTIPSSLGYGDRPNASIPANSTLVFEVEMLGIK